MIYTSYFIIALLSLTVADPASYDFQPVIDILKEGLSSMGNAMSFLVMKADGTILIKEHLASSGTTPYNDDTILHIASGCKWPAMATIMVEVDNGSIDLTTTVGSVYSSAPANAKPATLLQLMTHQGGYKLADDWIFDTTISLQDSVTGIFAGGTVYAGTSSSTTAAASQQYFTPGTKVGYSDIGMQIAGGMVEQKTSNTKFNDLFQTNIASKLGMKNAKFTSFDGVVGTSIAVADGLLISMLDYSKFLRMILNNGVYSGTQVITSGSITDMLEDYTGNLPLSSTMNGLIPSGMTAVPFGIGSWIYESANNKGTIYTSPGIHGFENYIDVVNKYLMIMYLRTSEDLEPKVVEISEKIRPMIKSIVLTGSYSFSNLLKTSLTISFLLCGMFL